MTLIPRMSPMAAKIMRLASTGALVGAAVGLPTVYSLAAHTTTHRIAPDAADSGDRLIGDTSATSSGAIASLIVRFHGSPLSTAVVRQAV